MEKRDLIMRALAVGQSATVLYAGRHDVTIETRSADYGFGVIIMLYPRNKEKELIYDKSENGRELRLHSFEFFEWNSFEDLQKEFSKMNKFMFDSKKIGI